MSTLLGPDGKEMAAEPVKRPMPTRKEKFDLVFMMVTLMTAEERRTLIKMLRPLRRKLDVMYPNGMTEGDIKNDIEKAAAAVVPDPKNDVVAPVAQGGAEQSIYSECQINPLVEEATTDSAQ